MGEIISLGDEIISLGGSEIISLGGEIIYLSTTGVMWIMLISKYMNWNYWVCTVNKYVDKLVK